MANKRVQIWQFRRGYTGSLDYVCSKSMAVSAFLIPTVLYAQCGRVAYKTVSCVRFLGEWWAIRTDDGLSGGKLGAFRLSLPGLDELDGLVPEECFEWWREQMIAASLKPKKKKKQVKKKRSKRGLPPALRAIPGAW